MTQYNSLNVKISNSQLNKLKSVIKNGTKVTLNLSWNDVNDSNDDTNFPHELLFTDTPVSKIRKAFSNGPSANIKFSKTLLSKMKQWGGFLGELLVGIPYAMLHAGKKGLKKYIISKKCSTRIS